MRFFSLPWLGMLMGFLVTLTEGATSPQASLFWNRCPRACDKDGPDQWPLYHSIDHLTACNQAMLLHFAVYNPLEDPRSQTSIRACTASNETSPITSSSERTSSVAFDQSSVNIQLGWWGKPDASYNSSDAQDVVSKIQAQLHQSAASPSILFGYSNKALVGVHIGQNLQPAAVASGAVQQLLNHLQNEPIAPRTVLQYCGQNANKGLGVVVDTTGNLAAVQQIVRDWLDAKCQTDFDGTTALPDSMLRIASTRALALAMAKPSNNRRSYDHRFHHSGSSVHRHHRYGRSSVHRRATCETIQVASGDSCGSLAENCGISAADFTKYNPSETLCSELQVGQYVCCTTGSLPDLSPKPNEDGACATHLVEANDYCSKIAAENSISVDDIESFNENTWGWMGCDNLQAEQKICLSEGDTPMPAVLDNAVCGPQMSGTEKPTDGTSLADLNPCPLNACCDVWGQCGITPEFCTDTESPTGAPGTAEAGTNGCISNCGTEIMNSDEPPEEFMQVGYFEAWNLDRSCLVMDISNFDTETYTHVHFAFGSITNDYQVSVADVQDQFDKFTKLQSVKRILSFGGWSFSTSQDSYPIFRESVTEANRKSFAQNVVAFLEEHDLDGLDFDWEYPGAPDIPGIPPGSDSDGPNYLSFLKEVRALLPEGKSLSIAAPASFWYLRGFPIADMAPVLDYIIYMTYDLHGQWDYGNEYAVPDCPSAACLRSHVNLTDTSLALSMITKAGVPTNKLIMGISSYGRSFEMTTAGCTGPLCTYVGPESGATPGKCTITAGYIANAEINSILENNDSAEEWWDADSDSNIMVYDTTQWVGYMNDTTKWRRTDLYRTFNMGGISDWAVDLNEFMYGEDSETLDDLVYISPVLWDNPSPQVTCQPPCTLVLPPFPLGSTTTIPWPEYTTTFVSSNTDDGRLYTKTSTHEVDPIVTDHIDLWPVTIDTDSPSQAPFTVIQSIKPPPFIITLPPYEANIPPTRIPTVDYDNNQDNPADPGSTPSPTITSGETVSSTSSSSSSDIVPVFITTSHPVTVQPQPTISITTPLITIPSVMFHSGSIPAPTATSDCDGCGKYDCRLFGCGGGCGLFGCNGGCGIFGCGGAGCGLSVCSSNCPLFECGGPGCATGSCGETGCPNGDCSISSCEPTTATNCVEYCTVTTNAPALMTTSCTSTTCLPTVGCEAHGTTETVTSTSDAACPVFTDIPSPTVSQDRYEGCNPCAWAAIPLTANSGEGLLERRMPEPVYHAMEKRAREHNTITSSKIGGCDLPTPLTLAWQGGGRFLNDAVNGKLKDNQKDMPRWYSKTVEDCVPKVTQIGDQAMKDRTKIDSSQSQGATNDHVWERNWFNAFWTSVMNRPDWDCDQFTKVMFNKECSTNLLQTVFNAVANNDQWDFVGMTHEVNSHYKGMLGEYDVQLLGQSGKVLRSNAITPTIKWGRNGKDPAGRTMLDNKIKFLERIEMACNIWTLPDVVDVLDRTNNKIYTELLAVDRYTADNTELDNTDLAQQYMIFMNNRMSAMMGAAHDQAVVFVKDIDSSFDTIRIAANRAGNDGLGEYTNLQEAYNDLVLAFNLRSEDICREPIDLSWKPANSKRNLGDDVCTKPSEPTATTSSTSSASTGDGSGGGGSGTMVPNPYPTAQLIIGLGNKPSSLDPNNWEFYTPALSAKSWSACDSIGRHSAPDDLSLVDPPFPEGKFDLTFEAFGPDGCSYRGTVDAPGKLSCPELLSPVQCFDYGYDGSPSTCYQELGAESVAPMVVCQW